MSEFVRYNEAECVDVFDRLFPEGFAGKDVLDELAPTGWQKSPLLAVFHPSVEQIHQESRRMHEGIRALRGNDGDSPALSPPSRDEIAAEFRSSPIEVEREVRELVGMCVWNVFSDNHQVVGADGRVVDLGSFRASGAFIADWLNGRIGRAEYDYINFFLGTKWVDQRADLTPVYPMIFRRLKACAFDWIYHFPRLYLIDFRPLKRAVDGGEEPDWVNYEPSRAIAEQQEEEQRRQELAELRASLDAAHREAVVAARSGPPPTIVAAYRACYGRFPRGWPPDFDA